MLEVKNLVKNFSRKKVLKGIDLKVNKGEIIGEEEYINRLIPQKGVVVVTKERDGDTDSKKDNELIIALMGI